MKHHVGLLAAGASWFFLSTSFLCDPAAVAGCMKDGPDGLYFEANPALCPGSVGPLESHFTSIAVSDSTGAWGDSWSADSRAEADRAALANCKERATDCKVDMWAQGECIALAMASDNSWGVGIGDSRASAESDAIGECRGVTKEACAIQAHPCSEDSP